MHWAEWLVRHAGLDLAALGLVAARVAPLTVVAPWLAFRGSPPALRAVLIVALTWVFGGVALGAAPDTLEVSPLLYMGWLVRELLVGTLFALASSLPIYALDWAGRLVDTWRGASLAEILAPGTGERSSPVGVLYLLMGIASFAALGGHRAALRAFGAGFISAPIGQGLSASMPQLALESAELTASALAFALAIAAPAAAAIVLVELALGLLARTAPQVPVFFAGMPLRAAAGLSAMLLGLAMMSAELPGVFRAAIGIAERWLEQL